MIFKRLHLTEKKRSNYSFLSMFISFLLLFIFTPLVKKGYGKIFIHIWINFIFFSAIMLLSRSRWQFVSGIFLGVTALILGWIEIASSSSFLISLSSLCVNLLFLSFVITILFQGVFLTHKIKEDLIFGALCIYLLIGIFFAHAYSIIELIYPGSFLFSSNTQTLLPSYHFQQLTYFSFVTLSTLGYGDITPTTTIATNLSIIEAIIGQFYIATLVAGLLGKLLKRR